MSEEAINAMNNLAEAINNYTNEIRRQDPNRLLDKEDVAKEYDMHERTVYNKIFNNPDVVVNRISKKIKIKNSELWKFFETAHKN